WPRSKNLDENGFFVCQVELGLHATAGYDATELRNGGYENARVSSYRLPRARNPLKDLSKLKADPPPLKIPALWEFLGDNASSHDQLLNEAAWVRLLPSRPLRPRLIETVCGSEVEGRIGIVRATDVLLSSPRVTLTRGTRGTTTIMTTKTTTP